MPPGLILESLVAVLLVVTIVYCVKLELRLRALRSGQDGLKEIIGALNTATVRAQTSVAELRAAAESVRADLGDRVSQARSICDELSLMIETGNNLADRLAGKSAPARGPRADDHDHDDTPKAASQWEQALLKALREAR